LEQAVLVLEAVLEAGEESVPAGENPVYIVSR
jgi:hypothetical protein